MLVQKELADVGSEILYPGGGTAGALVHDLPDDLQVPGHVRSLLFCGKVDEDIDGADQRFAEALRVRSGDVDELPHTRHSHFGEFETGLVLAVLDIAYWQHDNDGQMVLLDKDIR